MVEGPLREISDSGDASARSRLAPGILGIAAIALFCLLEPSLWPAGLIGAGAVLLAVFRTRPVRRRMAAVTEGAMSDDLPSVSAFELADAILDPMILFDRQGIVVHANAAAIRAFGDFSPGAMMQLRFRAPELLALIEGAVADATLPAPIDYVERVPIERMWRVNVRRVGSHLSLYVLVLRDQSEVRRVDRMRADFIANASHELRTPLASVSGFIETLRGPARNDEKARDRFLGIMHEQTGRMARLIDDLLSLSRIEMKAMPAPGEKTDLTALLLKVVEANALRAQEAGVEIVTSLPDKPYVIAGDRDELFQVFENLVENACKYGNAGGRVEVGLERAEDDGRSGVSATVRDNGAGMAPEHLPRITERFYRIDPDTSRKGTGLGLSIVKHIVTRHHARLTIRSNLGEGTSFAIFFPDIDETSRGGRHVL